MVCCTWDDYVLCLEGRLNLISIHINNMRVDIYTHERDAFQPRGTRRIWIRLVRPECGDTALPPICGMLQRTSVSYYSNTGGCDKRNSIGWDRFSAWREINTIVAFKLLITVDTRMTDRPACHSQTSEPTSPQCGLL